MYTSDVMEKKYIRFNPNLTRWLNDRDYVTGDWPDNVSPLMQEEADLEVGNGCVLDEYGWPICCSKCGTPIISIYGSSFCRTEYGHNAYHEECFSDIFG